MGYYKMTGAPVGATLGAARRSEVILFMTDTASASRARWKAALTKLQHLLDE